MSPGEGLLAALVAGLLLIAHERGKEFNFGSGIAVHLPSDDLLRVITVLFDADDFDRGENVRDPAHQN